MKLTEVVSSNIKAVGHENNTLYIQYSGGVYAYENVSNELYEQLMKAESKGRFVAENIRGKYHYIKL